MARIRADLLIVRRGLASTRAKAQAVIASGAARIDGAPIAAPSAMVDEEAKIEVIGADPWVSRAGAKLAHALELFAIDPAGRICLDVGAATGGFTQVLRARGAVKVYAVDVGQGQLHALVGADPGVVALEGRDARGLTRADLPEPPDLIVCDASFIGLVKVLPAALALAAPRADLIALVKPQFEAGPGKGGARGVLKEADARAAAGAAIAELDGLSGFAVIAFADSPVRGKEGNLELLAHLRRC